VLSLTDQEMSQVAYDIHLAKEQDGSNKKGLFSGMFDKLHIGAHARKLDHEKKQLKEQQALIE